MRKISTLFFLILILNMGIKGQKPIKVWEDSLKIGHSMLPGFSVIIPEVGYEKTLKAWTKELQSGTKSKVMTDNTEMTIFGAIIKNIAINPMNVYSKLMDRDTALLLAAVFELKKDQYIERATGETDVVKAKSFLFNFAKDQYTDLASEQLKLEENKLRDLQKELGSLEKGQSGMEKSIRSSDRNIANEREKLVSLNNELTSILSSLTEERNQLISMEAGSLKDEKASSIKDLESKRNKVQKGIASSENRISKAENKIDKNNREIPKNDRTQEKYNNQISDQEAVVQKFTDKLNTIKGYR